MSLCGRGRTMIQEISQERHAHEEELLAIWEESVRATHLFLDESAIAGLRQPVKEALQTTPRLFIIRDGNRSIGFMGIEKEMLAMLFLHPALSARLLLFPILFRALKSSESLGIAAELKGIGSAERTILPSPHSLTSVDARILAAAALSSLFVVLTELHLGALFPSDAALMP